MLCSYLRAVAKLLGEIEKDENKSQSRERLAWKSGSLAVLKVEQLAEAHLGLIFSRPRCVHRGERLLLF